MNNQVISFPTSARLKEIEFLMVMDQFMKVEQQRTIMT